MTAQCQRSNVKGAAEIHGYYVRVSIPVMVWPRLDSELSIVWSCSRVMFLCNFYCSALVYLNY